MLGSLLVVVVASSLPSNPCHVAGVEEEDALALRSAASAKASLVQALAPSAKDIQWNGESRTVGSSRWLRVRTSDAEGWANGKFLQCKLSPADARALLAAPVEKIVIALRDKRMKDLASFVNPAWGLQFAPYVSVLTSGTVKVPHAELPGLFAQTHKRDWGTEDGSGDPLRLTFAEYYRRFVYDRDYVHPPNLSFNTFLGSSNDVNEVDSVFPQGQTAELLFAASEAEQFSSMVLVFERDQTRWWPSCITAGRSRPRPV